MPSLIFIMLRFFSPINDMKMPLSIIFSEYVITFSGMILARLFVVRINHSLLKKKGGGHIRKAVILGDTNAIGNHLEIKTFQEDHNVEVVGILSGSTLEWNTDFDGIRVFGGYQLLEELSAANESLSTVIVAGYLDREERIHLAEKCKALALELLDIRDSGVRRWGVSDLLGDFPAGVDLIPQEVKDYLQNKKLLVFGEESAAKANLRRICTGSHVSELKVESVFKDQYAALRDTAPDIVIDLFYLVHAEHDLLSDELYDRCSDYLDVAEKNLQTLNLPCTYLFVLPYQSGRDLESLLDRRIVSVLTGGMLTERLTTSAESLCLFEHWDHIEHMLSFIFKAIYMAGHQGGVYYAKSQDAINTTDLKALLCVSENQPGKKELGSVAITVDDPVAHRLTKDHDLCSTSFYGMYQLAKKQTPPPLPE